MKKKKVFISFDYTEDHQYKDLLLAWNANSNFDFSFNDFTSREIQSTDISRIKAALTTKIKQADTTFVIVGKNCCKRHKDHAAIGYNNWQEFEIEKSKENGNKLVAVKLNYFNASPRCLLNSGVSWAMSFNFASIKQALLK